MSAALRPMGLDTSQFRKLSDRLTRFAVSRGLSRADAEDCVQDAILVLITKHPEKDEVDAVPLAFRILRWKIVELHRRKAAHREGKTVQVDDLELADERGIDHNAEEMVALKEAVHRALDSLGRKCRELLLWQLEGLSGEEIAKNAGLSTRNAAYVKINRCKNRFKEAYQAILSQKGRGR